jgi:hypothetical protein
VPQRSTNRPKNLDFEVKARVSEDMFRKLGEMLASEPEGTKVSHLVRRAIEQYLESKGSIGKRKPRADV